MTISFSGLSSGIDTQSIIGALVSVQGTQQTLLANQQTTKQKTVDAYAALITKLNSMSTAATTVANTDSWVGTTATSSSTSVTATATGTTAGALTFDVKALSAAHTLISARTVTSTGDVVAPSGTISITDFGGTITDLSVGTGSLSEVVSAINSSSTGLVASTVQTSPGSYRLQVASRTTGEASTFSLSGITDGMNVLKGGSDALIHVGDAVNGYDATSTGNTYSDLVSGLSFTVSKLEDGVTVSSTLDGTDVAKTVSSMVDAANAVLAYIDTATAWDAATKKASPLNGESSVRALQQSLLRTVSSAGAGGVTLTRDGRLSFDQAAFVTAFKADPQKVAGQFGATAAFVRAEDAPSSTISMSGSTEKTRAGNYAITISQAAAREQWTVDVTGGSIEGQTLTVTRGSTTINYAAAPGEDLATSVAAINSQLAAASLNVVVADAGDGTLTLTATSAGSGGAFSAQLDGTDGTQVTVGQDVEGQIDGEIATGSGRTLSLPTGSSGAVGLSLVVDTTAADIAATGGSIATVDYVPGLARTLQQLVAGVTDSTGALTSGQKTATTRVNDLQQQIDNWTKRLSDYRARLVMQFTAMETAIATMKTSLTALDGLIASSSSTSSSSSSTSG